MHGNGSTEAEQRLSQPLLLSSGTVTVMRNQRVVCGRREGLTAPLRVATLFALSAVCIECMSAARCRTPHTRCYHVNAMSWSQVADPCKGRSDSLFNKGDKTCPLIAVDDCVSTRTHAHTGMRGRTGVGVG